MLTHQHGWDIFSAVALIVLVGYHLGTPLLTMMLGSGKSFGFSIELIVSMLLLPFAIDGFLLMLSRPSGRLPLLALTCLVGWILIGSIAAPPDNVRLLLNPAGSLAITCGAASVFYRGWPSLNSKLPIIVTCVIALFGLWMLAATLRGELVAYHTLRGESAISHEVGGMRTTEYSLFMGTQFCYALFLTKLGGGVRLWGYLLAAAVLASILLISGSAGAIVGAGLVICVYVVSGGMRRRTQLAVVALVTVLVLTETVGQQVEMITTKAEQMLAFDSHLEQETHRRMIYRDLYDTACEHPLFGIGYLTYVGKDILGRRKVPHQNVLGLAAQCGFPAALLLITFILTTMWTFWRRRPRVQKPPPLIARAGFFVGACLWILIYLQFRGLFMDSFTIKEGFFAVGAGLGTLLWMEHECERLPVNQRPRPDRSAVRRFR